MRVSSCHPDNNEFNEGLGTTSNVWTTPRYRWRHTGKGAPPPENQLKSDT